MACDLIVIGGGPNGLTLAALQAAGGRRVVVCERRDRVGGIAAAEEFHPGYRSAGLLHDSTLVRPYVVQALALERHGLELRDGRPDVLALGADGVALRVPGDPQRAGHEIGKLSQRDAARYLEYRAFVDRVRPVLARWLDRPPLDWVRFESIGKLDLLGQALRVRMLGERGMAQLLRAPTMPLADFLGEWFETGALTASLALPALEGTVTGPRAPATTAGLLRRESLAGPGVRGGGPALVAALERAARQAGAVIRTGAAVQRLIVDGRRVRGVVLEGGEELEAPRVAASCDPRQVFLKLLPAGSVPHRTTEHLRQFRSRGAVAQILLAVDRVPTFRGVENGPLEQVRIADDLDALERAFDGLKYGRMPDAPVLDVHLPTVESPQLAPEGHAVVSLLVPGVPHDLRGGWTAGAADRLAERCVAVLERHGPGISRSIVGRAVLTPAELASRYALPSGHPYHGEHALDQLLVRPAPDCVGYATPVTGLWLCGSGSHPGGGLTCAPGYLASRCLDAEGVKS